MISSYAFYHQNLLIFLNTLINMLFHLRKQKRCDPLVSKHYFKIRAKIEVIPSNAIK